ncbi:hypothetical protein [Neptuniibacter sp. QD37_11]|uniref:hypothetical protein n=1 Tax=Neptuniibacter sp. QD37_11 TaxID=3398209 RepID=UPI0039F51ABB
MSNFMEIVVNHPSLRMMGAELIEDCSDFARIRIELPLDNYGSGGPVRACMEYRYDKKNLSLQGRIYPEEGRSFSTIGKKLSFDSCGHTAYLLSEIMEGSGVPVSSYTVHSVAEGLDTEAA